MDATGILAALMMAAGGGLLAVGLWLLRRRIVLFLRGRRCLATITRWQYVKGELGGPRHGHIMHYSFVDDAGIVHAKTAGRGHLRNKHKAGSALPMRYDPANPSNAEIGGAAGLLLAPALLVLGGTLPLLLGLGIWFGRG